MHTIPAGERIIDRHGEPLETCGYAARRWALRVEQDSAVVENCGEFEFSAELSDD